MARSLVTEGRDEVERSKKVRFGNGWIGSWKFRRGV